MIHGCFRTKRFYLVASMVLTSVLSGCSSMMSPPTCPDSTGLECARTDQINRMVNTGQLGVPTNYAIQTANVKSSPSMNATQPYPSPLAGGQPLWYGTTVMQVWFAPFEDKKGNYHQASLIDTLVKPGHWVGHPPRSHIHEVVKI